MDHASTSFSTSQGDISDYAEPQESDNEMLSNEIDSRINKLRNYQAQIDIQLKHLISLSRQNYVLRQKQEVLKGIDTFVWNLQDMANNFKNAGQTIESNSFEMIEKMSKCINDPDASYVKMNFS